MKNRIEVLFNIAIIGLFISSLIFIGICVVTRFEDTMDLVIAFSCVTFGNLLNLLKNNYKKKNK